LSFTAGGTVWPEVAGIFFRILPLWELLFLDLDELFLFLVTQFTPSDEPSRKHPVG
jgi:hypothetical protein